MNDDRWKHDKGRDDDLPKVPGAPYAVPEGFFESETYLTFIDLLAEYLYFDVTPKLLAAAARRRRRAANAGSFPARPAIEGPPTKTGDKA